MKKVNLVSRFLDYRYIFEQDVPAGVGKHKGVPDEKFDPNELAMGIEVEKEHTDNPAIAKEIAKDHLAELPDYYTRLKKMEEEGKKELKSKEVEEALNPRGVERPMDGRGQGKGMEKGRRGGRNVEPCPVGGPGEGKGEGKGKGQNRPKKEDKENS